MQASGDVIPDECRLLSHDIR